MTGAVILARMTSSRFPGKALAPFRGRPLIAHVIERAGAVFERDCIVVAMSDRPTDDPLDAYVTRLGLQVFRGPHDDVFQRVRRCAVAMNAEWVVRINGDSPLMSPAVLNAVVARAREPYDLVTTIAPRTLPKGQNPEALRTAVMTATDGAALTASDREHVTAYYHRHPQHYRIWNVARRGAPPAELDFSVDTPDDLARLERLTDDEIAAMMPEAVD